MIATAETPMMQQYRAAKEAHPGMLLLFRMGDFYESFDDDAKLCARLLGLTLTTRDKQVPMAGFPHHQLENYLAKLLREGQRVAVCDQVEPDERQAVNRIVTPGITIDGESNERATRDAIAKEAWDRYGVLLIFETEDMDGITREVYGDDAAKLAPLIGAELQTADGIRWVVLPGEDRYTHQDAMNDVNSMFLHWDTSERDEENWHNVAEFCEDDDPGELPDGFKIEEPLTGDDITPRSHEPPAKVRPCLRCGSGLHPRCSTCKMCTPCCWCPKSSA